MRGQARAKLSFVLQAAILLGCAGCRSPGDWWRSRGLDLWDCVPTAVIRDQDLGFNISARVTLFAQTGLGGYGLNAREGNSYGMALGRWGPRWNERVVHVIIGSFEQQELVGNNWSGGPDRRFRRREERAPLARQNGNVFVLIPLAGVSDPPSDPGRMWYPDWYSFPDSEFSLFAGWWGVRIGVAPAQFVDFLCGFVNLDPMGDDAPPKDPERNPDPSGDEPRPSSPSPATEPQGQAEG